MSHPVEELTALLDGALESGARAEVERHLAGCAACRAERDRLARTVSLLAQLPPAPAPSPSFEARLHARLAAERSRPTLWDRLRWRPLAPGLAGLVAAAGVFLYVHRQRSEEAFLAEHLDLFENWEAVRSVGAVDSPEDLQIAMHLDELSKEHP